MSFFYQGEIKMQEIYDKLNYYLNEICNYLEENDSFLLENIEQIARLNDVFLNFIEKYSLEAKTVENHLTSLEVYSLAREIIEKIDENYLLEFDQLISSGELDFSYAKEYNGSQCLRISINNQVKQLININREFNYNDVVVLVHEFIHYTNGNKRSKNEYYLGEFLSIYFEMYALFDLLNQGINKEEIDYFYRIKSAKRHANGLYHYEVILLAYLKFGNLSDNTVTLLQKYFCSMKKEDFEKECKELYQILTREEEKIKENPKAFGYILSDVFINSDYRYLLGTLLAIYALKESNFSDIVYLNHHIHEYEQKTISDICLSIGIDLFDQNFLPKLFVSIDECIKDLQKEYAPVKK